MNFFDTHAHYWDNKFAQDLETLLPSIFEEVSYIVNVGTSPNTCLQTIEQAKKYSRMYTALGIHPTDCQYLQGKMEEELERVYALIQDPSSKCVALGEIGLDYHYEDTNKELQKKYFEAQLEAAKYLKLPVVIHNRDSSGDLFDILLKHPDVTGIIHSCSMSYEMAKELVKHGYYISFSGTVSFKNALNVQDCCKKLPRDRVLIETDCPYLTPHPHRGERNDSSYLKYTCSAIAMLWDLTEEETATILFDNSKRCFHIS